jgi:lipoyl(octanoyl) transferase
MHGFALNVHPQCLEGFNRIVPCGIHDRQVVTMEQLIPDVTMDAVADDIVEAFEQVFNATVVDDWTLTQRYDEQIDSYYAHDQSSAL